MMTSSNGNIFRVTGPLCGKFTGHRWIPLTKASDTELCCFLRSGPSWINACVNNREAGDLRRHHAHHDVIVKCEGDCYFTKTHHSCMSNVYTIPGIYGLLWLWANFTRYQVVLLQQLWFMSWISAAIIDRLYVQCNQPLLYVKFISDYLIVQIIFIKYMQTVIHSD